MEKLLVCDALDERDFLAKKIVKEIETTNFIGVHRKQDKLVENLEVQEFESRAKSRYQSIKDLIARWKRIDVAITESNAMTVVTLRSGKEMTRAAAIALRKSYTDDSSSRNFEKILNDTLQNQVNKTQFESNALKLKADTELGKYKEKFLGKDSLQTIPEGVLAGIQSMVDGLYPEIVDPLNATEELSSMFADYNNQLKELDSAIKVSNATTYIEF